MAVTITRTPWIDDDGTGTTGTVINNAVKTALYNDIDGGFAKLAQLTGGNAFTGDQTITGLLSAVGLGTHTFSGAGVGSVQVQIRNSVAGAANFAQLALGNDLGAGRTIFAQFSSTFSGVAPNFADATSLIATGGNGLSIGTSAAAPVRVYTNGVERLRAQSSGEILVATVTNVGPGALCVKCDDAHLGVTISDQTTAQNQTLVGCFNSAGAFAGGIQHSGPTTVVYNTSSDARLKDDAGRAVDVSALRAVVVHDFAWKADGRSDRGVFAQEAHAVFPRAVSVGTDETTESGALARPWMTDYSKFVPDLIVGWQHHDADLAELRALLVTLKGSADAE